MIKDLANHEKILNSNDCLKDVDIIQAFDHY